MKSILFIIAFLIVYGSLYPFHFSTNSISPESLQALFNFNLRQTSLTDIIANIVLFIPFGLFIRAIASERSTVLQFVGLALLTFVFAYGIQAVQLFTEDRKPWGGDAVWNMVGYFVGLGVYSFSRLAFLESITSLSVKARVSLLIALSIFVLELAPFAPSFDLDVLKQNVKALLNNPTIDWYWTIEGSLYWLVPFFLIKQSIPSLASLSKLSFFVFGVLSAKFIIVSSDINLTLLISGINGLLIWAVAGRYINVRFLALLMLAKIMSNGLHPFELGQQTKAFNWIPFTGSMNGNILFNIVVFAKKIAIYGATIWLLYLWNKRLLLSSVICCVALLITELLQTQFVGSTPESTDLILAGFIAFIFNQLMQDNKRENKDSALTEKDLKTGEQLMKNSSADSSSTQQPRTKKVFAGIAIIVALLFGLGAVVTYSSSTDIVVRQASWVGLGDKSLIFDHHTHSTFSDGSLSVTELAELAYIKGCDAFAITDHTDNQNNFRKERFDEINAMRKKYPVMHIFAGMEVEMPSYSGREHVNLFTTPEYEYQVTKSVMDALLSIDNLKKSEWDASALDAVYSVEGAGRNTIAIYNHPSRKDINKDQDENYVDIKDWNQNYKHIVAVSGAPGHQNKVPIGSYETKISTINRWDPFAAEVGGTWDRLLSEGEEIWAAIASSDYHSDGMDYAPCEFSRIHVNAPTRDYDGIIRALKAGTFWADHGKLLTDYRFTVNTEDGALTAHPGGTIDLAGNDNILNLTIAVTKSSEYNDDYFRFELISNCNSEQTFVESRLLPPEESQLLVPIPIFEKDQGEQCYVRSRVIRESVETDRLSAYSNPIFIKF